jgi:hypothetical protein
VIQVSPAALPPRDRFLGADWHPTGNLVVQFDRGAGARRVLVMDAENAYALARAMFAAAYTEPTRPRCLVRVQLSRDLFSSFLWTGRVIKPVRIARGLPEGSKLIDIRRVPALEIIEAEFEHPSFAIAGPTGPPLIQPLMTVLEQWPEPPAGGGA